MNISRNSKNRQANRRSVERSDDRNQKLIDLMERTGYPIMQMNGQRIYGPPKKWGHVQPKKGTEIFVGKIPKVIFEDELVPIFERVGPIYQMRLMMDFSGMNRGYGFVTYTTPEHAAMAVTCLNNWEIRPGRNIGVYKSVDNCRLFVGSIPLDKTKQEVEEELRYHVDGIVDIIMYPGNGGNNVGYNRGYVFVEFESHRSAAIARRLLATETHLWDNKSIAVDWAEPLPEVDPCIMEKVTVLYLRNLPMSLTNMELQMLLGNYYPIDMMVRVHKTSDYAFVHFGCRVDAENALGLLQGLTMGGNKIEVTWARPRIYSKIHRLNAPAQNFCTSVPPRMRKMVTQKKSSDSYSSCSSQSPPESSQSFVDSSPSTSPGSSGADANGNVSYINLNEPRINNLYYNVVPACQEEALGPLPSSSTY